ncbi:hypothetical protein D1AOALGA4SA_5742 [Olavius algarvensis Delta 1 endosymbiont]|nr:hypothetical protein D1AOALGA4SA_5742 [Olavius algarvensis Delta 1 endosymbiont]
MAKIAYFRLEFLSPTLCIFKLSVIADCGLRIADLRNSVH